MYIAVLTCVVLVQGLIVPSAEASGLSPTGRTFEHFEESKWNPINWFNSRSSGYDQKLNALYKVVDCLTRNETEKCEKQLDNARLFFKPKRTPKPANETETPES